MFRSAQLPQVYLFRVYGDIPKPYSNYQRPYTMPLLQKGSGKDQAYKHCGRLAWTQHEPAGQHYAQAGCTKPDTLQTFDRALNVGVVMNTTTPSRLLCPGSLVVVVGFGGGQKKPLAGSGACGAGSKIPKKLCKA